jgi:hypothetical protein
VRWTGENGPEVRAFVGHGMHAFLDFVPPHAWNIDAPDGSVMRALPGDVIVRDADGALSVRKETPGCRWHGQVACPRCSDAEPVRGVEPSADPPAASRGYTVNLRGVGATGLVVRSWSCSSCGGWDDTIERGAPHEPRPCPGCGELAEPTISAASVKIPRGSVLRGKSAPPPTPYHLDTTPLADGMDPEEFRARRRKLWWDHDTAEARAKGAPV